jgi:hypothetical protein
MAAAEQPDIGKSKARGPSVGWKTGSATRINSYFVAALPTHHLIRGRLVLVVTY